MTHADWLDVLLATTVVLRGLGAGIIWGVLTITVPTRRRVGLVPYAQSPERNIAASASRHTAGRPCWARC